MYMVVWLYIGLYLPFLFQLRYSSSPSPLATVGLTASSSSSASSSTVSSLVSGAAPVEVYICPTCAQPDDGTPMIACDKCDVWYHM